VLWVKLVWRVWGIVGGLYSFIWFGGNDKRVYLCIMIANKYPKVDTLPNNAVKVSIYAASIGQRNPSYICVCYDRYLTGKGAYPKYNIINWQGTNFVIPD